MILDNMNILNFVLKKDYIVNRLKSGVFQLLESINILVDEIVLEVGQLNGNGVKNIIVLGNVIFW